MLTAAIDELVEADPMVLGDAATVRELHRQLDRLDAVSTRAAASFDAGGQWELDGARSAASWISTRCHRARSSAHREVHLGRALRYLPACEQAWLAGDIGAAHVQLLARLRRPATAEPLATDEAMLVGHASCLRFHQFAQVAAYWAQRADPDGEDERAADQRSQRRLHLSQTFEAMWVADGVFDPLGGAVVAKELKRLEDQLFRADWAAARDRLGQDPSVNDLGRSGAQRRADALIEMAIRSSTAPADGRRPAPLFSVVVGWETLKGRICQLANGTVIAPGALIPWLSAAYLERVVFDGPSRVIDVGVRRRLFDGATRRAVEVRDQECFHQFCDATADDGCQVDHIIPHAAGGPTTQDNGRLACGFHNRARTPRAPPDE